jgi:hypothetical protein
LKSDLGQDFFESSDRLTVGGATSVPELDVKAREFPDRRIRVREVGLESDFVIFGAFMDEAGKPCPLPTLAISPVEFEDFFLRYRSFAGEGQDSGEEQEEKSETQGKCGTGIFLEEQPHLADECLKELSGNSGDPVGVRWSRTRDVPGRIDPDPAPLCFRPELTPSVSVILIHPVTR